MAIIQFAFFGLFIGFIARALMPEQRLRLGALAALGLFGSFVGGFVAALGARQPVTRICVPGIYGSVIGGCFALVLLLWIYRRDALT